MGDKAVGAGEVVAGRLVVSKVVGKRDSWRYFKHGGFLPKKPDNQF